MSSPEKSSPDRLVYMANQIGKFFVAQDMKTASAAIAEHLEKFWEPRMRMAVIAHLRAGGAGLDPSVREAVGILRSGQ